jgi:hypothetical protein
VVSLKINGLAPKQYYSANESVTLGYTAKDAFGGDSIKSVACTLSKNGAAQTFTTQPSAEGNYIYAATATDTVGNVSQAQNASFIIDKTVPTIQATKDGIALLATQANYGKTGEAVTISGTDALSGFSSISWSLNGGVSQTGPLILVEGTNSYIVSATDKAGNTAVQNYTITASSTPITIPLGATADPSSIRFANPNSGGTEQIMSPDGSSRLGTDQIRFYVEENNGSYCGDYNPPAQLVYEIRKQDDTVLYGATSDFAKLGTGTNAYEAFAQLPALGAETIPDGSAKLVFNVVDKGGLGSSASSLSFILHRAGPPQVVLANIARTSSGIAGIWTYDALQKAWSIARGDVATLGTAWTDGIQVNGYTDGNYAMDAYTCFISSGGEAATTAFAATYPIAWSGDIATKTISIIVRSETGIDSPAGSFTIVKPVDAGTASPGKECANKDFTIQWTETPFSDPAGMSTSAQVYWRKSSSEAWALVPEGQGGKPTLMRGSLLAGDSISYYTATLAVPTAGEENAISALVNGAELNFAIPYEPLDAVPAACIATSYVAEAGAVSVRDLNATAADGLNIAYRLALMRDGGPQVVYEPDPASDAPNLLFNYSLWDLFPDYSGEKSAKNLNDLLGASTLRLRVDSHYSRAGSPSSVGIPSQVIAWDFEAPSIAWYGMMASLNKLSADKTISGKASDNGVSGVASVELKKRDGWDGTEYSTIWSATSANGEAIEFSHATGLADGKYSFQMIAQDRAGNVYSSPIIDRQFDTSPPSFIGLRFLKDDMSTSAERDSAQDAYLADADGSLRIEVQSAESGGTGLRSIEYSWGDPSTPGERTPWATAVAVATTEGRSVATIACSRTGRSTLHIKLIDSADNRSAEQADAGWVVYFDTSVPTISRIAIEGLVKSWGIYYHDGSSTLVARCEGPKAIDEANLRWNLVEVSPEGTVADSQLAAARWGAWGSGYASLLSRIATDGQRYKLMAMARNANGQASDPVGSLVFIRDGSMPAISAALASQSSAVAGSPIAIQVTGSDAQSGLSWTWGRKRTDISGAAETIESFTPGEDVAISTPGAYELTIRARNGAGLTASAAGIAVTVTDGGLVVRDYNKYCGRTGSVGGSWNYLSGSPALYRYHWETAGGRQLSGTLDGDLSRSAVLDLSMLNPVLENGDIVRLVVEAFDADGLRMGNKTTSAGCTVDAVAPDFTSWKYPSMTSTRNLHVEYEATDSGSGLAGASVLVRKVDGNGTPWSATLDGGDGAHRYSFDIGQSDFATGDRIVVELTVSDRAGLATTKASGIVLLDDSPPPAPTVIESAEALRFKANSANGNDSYQKLGFSWDLSVPDPESGTLKYYWKTYTTMAEYADDIDHPWTEAPSGTESASGLDYSASGYQDGTVLHVAVKAVNGVGLATVGFGNGVILDSKAPLVWGIAVFDKSKNALGSYVTMATLTGAAGGDPAICVATAAEDTESGLSQYVLRTGTWISGQGFFANSAVEDTVFDYDKSGGSTVYSPLLPLTAPQTGSIWMVKGYVYDKAGNASVVYSPGFKIVDTAPSIVSLYGEIGPDTLSYSWTIGSEETGDCDYAIAISYTRNGATTAIRFADEAGNLTTEHITTLKQATFDWRTLGLERGDVVECIVTPRTEAGSGAAKSHTLTVIPDVPTIAVFDYSRFFSDHMNVRNATYTVGDTQVGYSSVREIQWRLRDALTGGTLQSWTADYSGRTITVKTAFTALETAPYDTERLVVELRARSLMGAWSAIETSKAIIVDASPAESVSISRESAYDNAPGGIVGGWKVAANDGQSGITAFRMLLTRETDITELDWNAGQDETVSNNAPGTLASLEGLGLKGVGADDGDYYAYVRARNGTDDWSPASRSGVVHIDRTPPSISLAYPATVRMKDEVGALLSAYITNSESETLTALSSKPGTTFSIAVNGGNIPAPVNVDGQYGGDASVKSYGPFTLDSSGTRTKSIIVTGKDLYGNTATATGTLRFNEAPSIFVLDDRTNSARIVELERIVDVSDGSLDYPLTYLWTLGGGQDMSGVDGIPYTAGPTDDIAIGGYHSAKFFQSGKLQATHYPMTLSVTDRWGKTSVASIDMVVELTTSGTLCGDEIWSGDITLLGSVEVPSGIKLTIDGASVKVKGAMAGQGLLATTLTIELGGVTEVSAGGGSFASGEAGYRWTGIDVLGELRGSDLAIADAVRALVVRPSASITLAGAKITGNMIGLHLVGGTLNLSGSTLADNDEYAVKEDGAGVYALVNNLFHGNGVDYYERLQSRIDMGELNAIAGNSGNARY